MSPPFYLLYRTGFAPSNGTSVQLSRLLAGHEQEMLHLMWDIEEGGADSVPNRIVVDDAERWQWPFTKGRGVYSHLMKQLQIGWWGGHQLNVAKLGRRLRQQKLQANWAYIVCMREWDARRAFALKQALGCSDYVLHIMDIFHQELGQTETPVFVELVRGARHVFCISGMIEAEVKRWGAKATSIVPCVTDFTPAEGAVLAEPLRIVLTGSIWVDQYSRNPALDILTESWSAVVRRFPKAELHYAGAVARRLPQVLQSIVSDHGLLPPPECERLLRSCHVAFLPVSHPSDTVGRYSVPSRLADFLACGLPTITSTDADTSIASFMRQVPGSCSANVTDSSSLLNALERFASDPAAWRVASSDAAHFARHHLSSKRVGQDLFKTLSQLG